MEAPCISLPTMATCWLVVVSDHMVASMRAAPSSSPAHWACLRPSMNATPAGWCSTAASSIHFDWRHGAISAAKLVGYKARLVDWARHVAYRDGTGGAAPLGLPHHPVPAAARAASCSG